MMRIRLTFTLLAAFCVACLSWAQQPSDDEVAYFSSSGFNVPALAGWRDQSSGSVAQFQLAAAGATIRTALVNASDAEAAARADLATLTSRDIGEPLYLGRVNLADGTWTVAVYEIDATTTASIMARRAGERYVVISFVESDTEARTVMLTVAQANAALDRAKPEVDLALDMIIGARPGAIEEVESVNLPSGNWEAFRAEGALALGMVFGNDSYIALRQGDGDMLAELALLADAYNRTVLGFFITPDNSLYLTLGVAATFAILGLLIFSFVWRSRSMGKDLALLEELARDEN